MQVRVHERDPNLIEDLFYWLTILLGLGQKVLFKETLVVEEKDNVDWRNSTSKEVDDTYVDNRLLGYDWLMSQEVKTTVNLSREDKDFL